MRIHRLEVEGFRSLKKVSWEPGALNVVIGPNGAGKSNLLLLFDILKTGAIGKFRDKIEESGGISSIAWDSDADKIFIKLILNDYHDHTTPETDLAEYSLSIACYHFIDSYSITNETLILSDTVFNRSYSKGYVFQRTTKLTTFFQTKAYVEADTNQAIDQNELFVSAASSSFTITFDAYKLHNYFKKIDIFSYINSSRESKVRLPTSVSLERIIKQDGSNLIQVLHTLYTSDRNFEADIDSAMNAAFGNDYEKLVFPPASDQRVQLRIRWKSLKHEQSAQDISDGTLRFLYLLAILANPEPSPLIAIDEPETGLHPSMFPIIAEFARECSRKSQVIFTTHSPQFLDAFGDKPPTVTVAQWVDGETILKVLDGERLAKWLKHYSMGQMFMSGELEDFD